VSAQKYSNNNVQICTAKVNKKSERARESALVNELIVYVCMYVCVVHKLKLVCVTQATMTTTLSPSCD